MPLAFVSLLISAALAYVRHTNLTTATTIRLSIRSPAICTKYQRGSRRRGHRRPGPTQPSPDAPNKPQGAHLRKRPHGEGRNGWSPRLCLHDMATSGSGEVKSDLASMLHDNLPSPGSPGSPGQLAAERRPAGRRGGGSGGEKPTGQVYFGLRGPPSCGSPSRISCFGGSASICRSQPPYLFTPSLPPSLSLSVVPVCDRGGLAAWLRPSHRRTS